MQELPLNGRNWLQLTMLTPGSRVNSVTDSPFGNRANTFQLNLDGQQVSQTISGVSFGSAKFSQDSIAEVEFITSRFDATQGRSLGVQVNAVTKSGTNTFTGTVSGYFRHDQFNAADFIAHRVLPYSDQQLSTTFGGPIRRNRAHFFLNYEGERNPQTFFFTSPFAAFNLPDITDTRTEHKVGGRFDSELNQGAHLMVRGNFWRNFNPYENSTTGGTVNHPSRASSLLQKTHQVFGTLTNNLGSRMLNELKVGYNHFLSDQSGYVPDAPEIRLRGYTIGKTWFYPIILDQKDYSIRNNFNYFTGAHELKTGGELNFHRSVLYWPSHLAGTFDMLGGPIPANIESLFPVWDDPSTWNLGALSPITRSFQQGFGNFDIDRNKPEYAVWIQDNWKVTGNLTLNLGLRYDLAIDGWANSVEYLPFKRAVGQDWTNFAPRLGFAYALPDRRTVIRGGFGNYFTGTTDNAFHYSQYPKQVALPLVTNDGRPNFAADPWNVNGGGHVPTPEEAQRLRVNYSGGAIPSDENKMPHTYHTAIGLQRQLGETMAFQADYVWMAGRRQEAFATGRPINLSYNPVTGANYPYTDISRLPYPDFGYWAMNFADGRNNYHGLEMGFTRRLQDRWQLSATYTLSGSWDSNPLPLNRGCQYPLNGLTMTCDTPLTVAADLGGEYGLAVGDQRHRAVLNGILELPGAFQVSGLYFFGSGERFATTYGADLRQTGGVGGRLRPNGTIVPRNDFVGKPLHRVDMRVSRRFVIARTLRVDALAEVFNLLNHANYGTYVTNEASTAYGLPVQNINTAFQPRTAQLGFRVAF
jgi:hypothetical protein